MHRVRADLAGCNENSVCWMLRLRWLVACCGYVGRPSPMVTTGLFGDDLFEMTILDGARSGRRRL